MPIYTQLPDALASLPTLATEPLLGIDLETSGLSPWNDQIAVITLFGQRSETTAVFHVRGSVPQVLKNFLSQPRLLVGHNVTTFDALFLANAGVDIMAPTWFDTLIAEQVLITTSRSDVRKNLQASIKRRLGRELDKSINHGGWMSPQLSGTQLEYVVGDVKYLPKLMEQQLRDAEEKGLTKAIEFEMSLTKPVMAIQLTGLPVDLPVLREWRSQAIHSSLDAGIQLQERLGPINLASPIQITKALSRLGVGWESTSRESLQAIIAEGGRGPEAHIAELLLEFRYGQKRASMYSESWIRQFIHTRDGVPFLHARLSQVGTDTGRFSSSEPNIQQLPKVGNRGRPYIGGREGYSVISVDYAGIEAVVAAALAKDQAYLSLLKDGDLHKNVASQVFQVPVESVSPEQRQLAKAMSFTLLFGGGAGRLLSYATNNGAKLTLDEATALKDRFFARYPGLLTMRRNAYTLANDSTPVTIELPTGLRRVIVGQKLVGTTLLNTKVQGTAAAGMKYAILEAWKRGLISPGKGIGATVHDELVACVPHDMVEEFALEIKECMLHGMKQIPAMADAPVKCGTSIASYWSK